MESRKLILSLACSVLLAFPVMSQQKSTLSIDFLGDKISANYTQYPYYQFDSELSAHNIADFFDKLNGTSYQELINTILKVKEDKKLDDWLFYQLVRRAAQQLSPKANNYISYTIYKWFLLNKSGYNAILRISENKILFYVQSDETVYNIPYLTINNKQYICLNYHDYGYNIDFEKEHFSNVDLPNENNSKAFTYKITSIPEFNNKEYIEKNIGFNYSEQDYSFRVKLNPEIKTLFNNYPAADYSNHFNIPLSKETYNSLIPALKDIVGRMNTKNGIDYLMHFTRYAFLFEKDADVFGQDKRFSPEETLLYEHSDCEDRAALFYCLVREIYNLPMIVLVYPQHVSIAVELEKPIGDPIVYNGKKFSICEPTPQKRDLPVGKQIPSLKNVPYEIAFEYIPSGSVASLK